MNLDFLDAYTIGIMIHVFGAILGAGAAFVSDGMFFSSIKDGRMTATELRFLRLGSHFVWTGVGILIFSGIFLVALDPTHYLNSSKFLAKMTIVAVIIANGLVFHLVHVPVLHRHEGIYFSTSAEFRKKSSLILVSGAVSMISWLSAIILGMIKYLPFEYGVIMGVYIGLITCASLGALLSRKYIFRFEKTGDSKIGDSVALG